MKPDAPPLTPAGVMVSFITHYAAIHPHWLPHRHNARLRQANLHGPGLRKANPIVSGFGGQSVEERPFALQGQALVQQDLPTRRASLTLSGGG